ncbi:unnamed protein product [Amoebophrya sp. A25]|nr:unnamed protein product [Amoebophrya sp. A25]|eukprot:GSA25T00021526001.1
MKYLEHFISTFSGVYYVLCETAHAMPLYLSRMLLIFQREGGDTFISSAFIGVRCLMMKTIPIRSRRGAQLRPYETASTNVIFSVEEVSVSSGRAARVASS